MTRLDAMYTEFYRRTDPDGTYPNEYVVRILLGSYPRLALPRDHEGKRALDMGMGDGRNLRFLVERGFEAYGVEVSAGICARVSESFGRRGLSAEFRVGRNDAIPFADGFFDYLLSWNSSHYMGDSADPADYGDYVSEFARVLKAGGTLMLAVPVVSNFIFERSVALVPGYRVITDDPYGVRNDQVFRAFDERADVLSELRGAFDRFSCAGLTDDCFGQRNHYEIVVCRKIGDGERSNRG